MIETGVLVWSSIDTQQVRIIIETDLWEGMIWMRITTTFVMNDNVDYKTLDVLTS